MSRWLPRDSHSAQQSHAFDVSLARRYSRNNVRVKRSLFPLLYCDEFEWLIEIPRERNRRREETAVLVMPLRAGCTL